MFTLDAAPGRHRRLHPHHLLRLGHGGPPCWPSSARPPRATLLAGWGFCPTGDARVQDS